MKKKLIIAAAAAAVIIAALVMAFVTVSGTTSGSKWQTEVEEEGLTVSSRANDDGTLNIWVKGEFAADSWTCTSDTEAVASAEQTENKENSARFTLTPLGQGRADFTLADGEGHSGTASVYVDDEKKLQLVSLTLSKGEAQQFTGELDGYAYTLDCLGTTAKLTLAGASKLDFTAQAEQDDILSFARVYNDALDTDDEAADSGAESGSTEPQWGSDVKKEDKSVTPAPDRETEAADVSFTITGKKSGEGVLHICCADLTRDLEITASVDSSNIITISKVETAYYTYVTDSSAVETMTQLMLGSDFLPENFRAESYTTCEDAELGYGALKFIFNRTDGTWAYEVAKNTEEALAVRYHLGEEYTAKEVTRDGKSFTVYSNADGSYAVWSRAGGTVLVYPESGEPDNLEAAAVDIISKLG